jgi:hypothetical protein
MVELEKRGFDIAAFLASADQGSLLDSRRRKHHQSLASRNKYTSLPQRPARAP